MDASTFTDYLEKRYQDQLNYYEKTSGQNQQKYKLYQWLLIILSTLTTILAALPSDKFDLKYFIVVAAGLVTILSSALKTFDPKENSRVKQSNIDMIVLVVGMHKGQGRVSDMEIRPPQFHFYVGKKRVKGGISVLYHWTPSCKS